MKHFNDEMERVAKANITRERNAELRDRGGSIMPDYVETSDLWFAGFLKSLGVKLIELKWKGKIAFFVFEEKGKDELINYQNGGTISAIALRNSVSNLRGMIKNTKYRGVENDRTTPHLNNTR